MIRSPRTLPPGLLAVCVLAAAARSQSIDFTPAYHPNGPDADYAEVFLGDPFTLEISLPGMDHAQSRAVADQWITFLLSSAGPAAQPIPIAPGVDVLLDPVHLVVLPAPPSLELEDLVVPPGTPNVTIPFQVVAVDTNDPSNFPSISSLERVALLTPPTSWNDAMVPVGSLAPGVNAVVFEPAQTKYVLSFDDGVERLEYALLLNDPGLSKGTIRVLEETTGTMVLANGGMYYSEGPGLDLKSPPEQENFGTHTLLSHGIAPAGDTVSFHWRDELPTPAGGTVVHERIFDYTVVGKSLRIRARRVAGPTEAADNYYGFTLGDVIGPGTPSTYEAQRIPYMEQIGITLVDDQLFHSCFIDLFQSRASSHQTARFAQFGNAVRNTEFTFYNRLSDGHAIPVDETGWVTISRDVEDVFVRSTAPPSPFAGSLGERVGVTFARDTTTPTTYFEDDLNVQRLKSLGMDDVFGFKFHWMHYGTNRRAPTHAPPNPGAGTEQQFVDLVQSALGAGWQFALYTDFYSLDQLSLIHI